MNGNIGSSLNIALFYADDVPKPEILCSNGSLKYIKRISEEGQESNLRSCFPRVFLMSFQGIPFEIRLISKWACARHDCATLCLCYDCVGK